MNRRPLSQHPERLLLSTNSTNSTAILTENRQKLDELASYLYEKETITGEEFMKILNG